MIDLHLYPNELINLKSSEQKVLRPDHIPIHPKVYDSGFVYTPEFMNQVRTLVPDSLRLDISTIEEMLEEDLEIEVEETHMIQKKRPFKDRTKYRIDSLDYQQIRFLAEPDRRFLCVQKVASLSLNPNGTPTKVPVNFYNQYEDLLSKEKLKEYSFIFPSQNKEFVHTWFIHSYNYGGIMMDLYLRNFAIAFNNLGLDKL
ncbi:MAG: hypothetical protein ACMXYG_07350 [Candidatus Woesearchaeota archaeon]